MYKLHIASTRLFMRGPSIFEEAAFSALYEWIGSTNWLSSFYYDTPTEKNIKTV